MTVIMLPPRSERDTEPPERASDSTMPPADLGPTGIALRLLALEEQVSDIHAETFGMSKSLDDISTSLAAIIRFLDKLAADVHVLTNDARNQRADRARMRVDMDKLEERMGELERKQQ
jgi:hypothetical protein